MKLYKKIQLGFWAFLVGVAVLAGMLFIAAWQEWGPGTAAIGLTMSIICGIVFGQFWLPDEDDGR